MAEGFFHPERMTIPNLPVAHLCAAMVRILPRTMLRLDIAASEDEARSRSRNELLPDGSECWHRFFVEQDRARVDDPMFATGMVRHEFSLLVKAGSAFPCVVPLQGGGTGFAISPAGHVLTNYHLVVGEVLSHGREAGALNQEVPCRTVRAQVARPGRDGDWHWQDAQQVWLVSNPPRARALRAGDDGLLHPHEDTALLRIEPAPAAVLRLSSRRPELGEPIWMAGFPLRSARPAEALRRVGYSNADGSLRVSRGHVTGREGTDHFTTDTDGSMGTSGSPVLDQSGSVIGLFARVSGDGPRNAIAFGNVERVHVTTDLAIRGLGLSAVLKSDR